MSNFIKQGSRKARLNKDAVSEQVEQAKKHDGNNWSLLATGRNDGLKDEDVFTYFMTFILSEFTAENGYDAASHDGHHLFTRMIESDPYDARLKPDLIPFECYIKPVGHPTKDGGYEVWDMHINNNVKELYLNFLKTINDGEKENI